MHFSATATYLFAMALPASATLNVHNWCTEDVYIYQSCGGSCDQGPSGVCYVDPWHIPAGGIEQLDWIVNSTGTSVKISKSSIVNNGILQYEYNMGEGALWWDLSDLDGSGAGVVGNPFKNDNVKVTPVGTGAGVGNCETIKCAANQVCEASYQAPDDAKTRWCPQTIGDFWIDLCHPESLFNKREINFSA